MHRVATGLAACLLASGALAQAPSQPTGPTITRPDSVKKPSSNDLAAVFPAEALRRGISGKPPSPAR